MTGQNKFLILIFNAMTIKQIASEYITPLFVAVMTSISFKIEGLLIKILSPLDFALEEVIHICSSISAVLGVTYLFLKIFFLFRNKGEVNKNEKN